MFSHLALPTDQSSWIPWTGRAVVRPPPERQRSAGRRRWLMSNGPVKSHGFFVGKTNGCQMSPVVAGGSIHIYIYCNMWNHRLIHSIALGLPDSRSAAVRGADLIWLKGHTFRNALGKNAAIGSERCLELEGTIIYREDSLETHQVYYQDRSIGSSIQFFTSRTRTFSQVAASVQCSQPSYTYIYMYVLLYVYIYIYIDR